MQKVEDPQQKLLGMTPNFTSGLHPTYMQSNAFNSPLVIPVLAGRENAGYSGAKIRWRCSRGGPQGFSMTKLSRRNKNEKRKREREL